MQQADLPGMKPKYRFEQAYESIRELADAFLAGDGFKTYSHEAALTYFKKLQLINDAELERLDACRIKRHDAKYYGANIPDAECERLTTFLKTLLNKISPNENETNTQTDIRAPGGVVPDKGNAGELSAPKQGEAKKEKTKRD
jgi:hypothetical protein